jgi:S1-C subfamily serine protease
MAEFPGKVVGTDEKTDIAVIKVDAANLPVVQLANSDAVRVGQFAFAIGAPSSSTTRLLTA